MKFFSENSTEDNQQIERTSCRLLLSGLLKNIMFIFTRIACTYNTLFSESSNEKIGVFCLFHFIAILNNFDNLLSLFNNLCLLICRNKNKTKRRQK